MNDEKYANLDKRMALIEQSIDIIQNNHLRHIQNDICTIKKWFGWAIGAVFVQLLAVIASMMF
tara:strand:+ start:681 stop:869 length:189 start_codon:yes stop_codon:yes gene_type:complete